MDQVVAIETMEIMISSGLIIKSDMYIKIIISLLYYLFQLLLSQAIFA